MPHSYANCLVCESPITHFSYGKTTLTTCTSCGVVALFPMPTNEERKAHYQKSYVLNRAMTTHARVAESRRWSRLPEQLKIIQDIQKYKQPPATVLDIGCDRGAFLDEIRRYGYECVGVEPSDQAREYARSIGLRVEESIDNLASDEKFDVVTMHHVLEHVDNPTNFLAKIAQHLHPNGIILIRVPDFSCLWSRMLRDKWIWFQPENHSFHFSTQSLSEVLRRNNFNLLHVVSQRPNSFLTWKAYRMATSSFRALAGDARTLKQVLSVYYQYLTAVEVYAVAEFRE